MDTLRFTDSTQQFIDNFDPKSLSGNSECDPGRDNDSQTTEEATWSMVEKATDRGNLWSDRLDALDNLFSHRSSAYTYSRYSLLAATYSLDSLTDDVETCRRTKIYEIPVSLFCSSPDIREMSRELPTFQRDHDGLKKSNAHKQEKLLQWAYRRINRPKLTWVQRFRGLHRYATNYSFNSGSKLPILEKVFPLGNRLHGAGKKAFSKELIKLVIALDTNGVAFSRDDAQRIVQMCLQNNAFDVVLGVLQEELKQSKADTFLRKDTLAVRMVTMLRTESAEVRKWLTKIFDHEVVHRIRKFPKCSESVYALATLAQKLLSNLFMSCNFSLPAHIKGVFQLIHKKAIQLEQKAPSKIPFDSLSTGGKEQAQPWKSSKATNFLFMRFLNSEVQDIAPDNEEIPVFLMKCVLGEKLEPNGRFGYINEALVDEKVQLEMKAADEAFVITLQSGDAN